MSNNNWGCDVLISLPEPVAQRDVLWRMGTHVFTEDGLRLNLSAADVEELSIPTFAPPEVD